MEELIHNNYRILTNKLINKNITISLMESCTSGLIASLITDTEGASKIFKGSIVSYSNEAKISFGVPAMTINKYGVYSEETAKSMAYTCKNTFSTDIGIGITGSLCTKDPVNDDSVPGEVYISIIYNDKIVSNKYIIKNKSRYKCKLDIAAIIYEILIGII